MIMACSTGILKLLIMRDSQVAIEISYVGFCNHDIGTFLIS